MRKGKMADGLKASYELDKAGECLAPVRELHENLFAREKQEWCFSSSGLMVRTHIARTTRVS
jgi:hypothetical protein